MVDGSLEKNSCWLSLLGWVLSQEHMVETDD